MKERLINEYDNLLGKYHALDECDRYYGSKKTKICRNMIYLLVAMIQLANGSRVTEACSALKLFLNRGYDDKVVVIIAKSKSTKYKDGKAYITKTRYRKMKFPSSWINAEHTLDPGPDVFLEYLDNIENLEKYTLNYMLRHFDCNTHSLRYAFINFMLYDQKKEMTVVAKHVGHKNIQQLITYTQNKESDKLFDIDI